MIANVLEAKDLINPNFAINGATNTDEQMDTYVKIFLLPDKNINVQTKIYRNSNSPSYQERVIFTLHPRDQMQTALLFHIYATDMNSHTLIGEGELSLADVSLRQPVTTWVTLTDTSQVKCIRFVNENSAVLFYFYFFTLFRLVQSSES